MEMFIFETKKCFWCCLAEGEHAGEEPDEDADDDDEWNPVCQGAADANVEEGGEEVLSEDDEEHLWSESNDWKIAEVPTNPYEPNPNRTKWLDWTVFSSKL